MDVIQIIVLGIVQGLTEFLPISSSAHLVLTSILLGWQDQGLLVDIAAHAGSLCAVMLFFRKELREMIIAAFNPTSAASARELRIISHIVIATLPIVIAGLLLADFIETYTRNAQVIAFTTIAFALLLAYADRNSRNMRDEYQLSWIDVLLIGCAQALALVPGTSRSGVTMTVGMMLGMTKVAAARFSFLISMPTILAAIAYKSMQVLTTKPDIDSLAVGGVFVLSGVVAYVCIDVFLRLVNTIGMMPFVIYRLILGILLFIFI